MAKKKPAPPKKGKKLPPWLQKKVDDKEKSSSKMPMKKGKKGC